jgi:hypothetical protein
MDPWIKSRDHCVFSSALIAKTFCKHISKYAAPKTCEHVDFEDIST